MTIDKDQLLAALELRKSMLEYDRDKLSNEEKEVNKLIFIRGELFGVRWAIETFKLLDGKGGSDE